MKPSHPGQPAQPANERSRLSALLAYELLDSPAEAMFDNITALAAQICATPIALISLVDAERQWFKSRVGLDARETPRELAFCAHAINADELFEIVNAPLDPRFRDNPLVTGAPGIRFYAGMPLQDSQGHNLGTLCVIDRQPRQLHDEQRQALQLLAAQTVQLFELRLQARRQAEQSALHRAILDSDGAAVLLTDVEGIIQHASPGFAALLGHAPQSLHGQTFNDLLQAPQAQPSVLAAAATDARDDTLSSLASEPAELRELYLRHRDSRAIPVSMLLAPISPPGQGPLGYLCVAHDLSFREKILQRLQKVTAHLPGAVYQFLLRRDGSSCLPYASQGIQDIFALSADDVSEDANPLFARIHPEDLDQVKRSINRSARDLEPWHQEFRVQHPSRGLLWVEGHASPQRLDDEALIWHGFINDFSERKRIEQMKDEFVSTISHELRTPLTSIAGSLGLINGGALGQVPAEMQQLLQIAQSNSQRLSELIDDLLDMDKLVAGKMPFNLQEQALQPLLEQAITQNQPYAQQHQIHLHLQEPASSARVQVDSQRLAQVLANLLSNAAKFSAPGQQVELLAQTDQHRVRISVRDYGVGIPDAFKARIFSKFSQADATDTRQKGGTGLGLAISKELVERVHGQIGFASQEGQGSTFWFELPLADGVPSA